MVILQHLLLNLFYLHKCKSAKLPTFHSYTTGCLEKVLLKALPLQLQNKNRVTVISSHLQKACQTNSLEVFCLKVMNSQTKEQIVLAVVKQYKIIILKKVKVKVRMYKIIMLYHHRRIVQKMNKRVKLLRDNKPKIILNKLRLLQ